MAKNPKYPPPPSDFEARLQEATSRGLTAQQTLKVMYPHYDFAAVRDWKNAQWKMLRQPQNAINELRESEGKEPLPLLPGQRKGRSRRGNADAREVIATPDLKYTLDAEPSIADLLKIKEMAEQKGGVGTLSKQLDGLGEMIGAVGSFEKLLKCLDALQKLA